MYDLVQFLILFFSSCYRVDVDPECLRWTPVISCPSSMYNSPYKREASFMSQSTNPSPRKRNDTLRQSNSNLDDSSLEEMSNSTLKRKPKKKSPAQRSLLTDTESTENEEQKLKDARKSFRNFTSTTTDDDKHDPDVSFSNGKRPKSQIKKNLKKLTNLQVRSGESKGLDGGATLDIVAIKSRLVDSGVSSKGRAKLVGNIVKNEGILHQAIGRLLVQADSKYLAFRSKLSEENDDADVEDEVDEKNNSNGTSKPKKRTPDMSSRYRRVAASKSSDKFRRRKHGKSSSNTSSDASSEVSPARRTTDVLTQQAPMKKAFSEERKDPALSR